MAADQFCRHCGQPLSPTAQQNPPSRPSSRRQKQAVNLPLVLGLVAGVVLIFVAIWLSLPDTAEAPSRLESNPVSQDNAGLPYPEVTRIELDEAKARFDAGTAVFVDTRKLEDYETAHIPGAILMTLEEIDARHMELTVSPEIITYCT